MIEIEKQYIAKGKEAEMIGWSREVEAKGCKQTDLNMWLFLKTKNHLQTTV